MSYNPLLFLMVGMQTAMLALISEVKLYTAAINVKYEAQKNVCYYRFRKRKSLLLSG